MRRFVGIVLFLIAFRCPAGSQILPLRYYTTHDGLISNTINDIFQDSRGYLWIATFDGLSMFDGSSFRNYTSLDGLAHHLAWCVTESKRSPGTLLIGTNGGGISHLQDGRFSTLQLGTGHKENEVNKIVEDCYGSLWCLTNSGVMVATDSMPTRLPLQRQNANRALALGADSVLWVAEDATLYRFSSSRRMLSRVVVPLRGGATINTLYPDKQGRVWVLGSDSSISLYRDTSVLLRRRIPEGMPGQMLIDHLENVWITILHSGLLRIPRMHLMHGQFEHITSANGLPSNEVVSLFLDAENNLWFGTYDKGIALLTERSVARFVEPKPTASGLEIDERSHAWATGESSVMEYWNDGARWRMAVHPVAPAGTTIRTMRIDHADRLWFTLTDNSIRAYRIHPGPSSHASDLRLQTMLRAGVHFPKSAPFLCFVDRSGVLWYTSEPHDVGIITLEPTPKFAKELTYPDHVPVDAIRDVYQDAQSNIWFGGFAEGLAMLPRGDWQNGRMRKLTIADGLPDKGVRSIAEDDSGRLWVGTRYGGLAIYDGMRFHTLTARNGLLSNAIWSITKGPDGTMWLGTSLGPMHVRSDPPYRTGWNTELTGTDARIVRVDRAGRVWSVGGAVLSLYEPWKRVTNNVPPPIHLSQLTLNGKPIPLRQHLELSYDQNNVVLQFIGLSFKGGVRYRFRLKGVVDEWSMPSAQRDVSYAALSPGSYTFEVVAVNSDGVESTQPASLSFTILPPVWRRPWFLVVAGLVLTAAFGGVVRYVSIQKLKRRVQELEKERAVQQERERTRERIARDLHDDVASTLGSVVIYAESLKRQVQDESESAGLADRISTLSQEAQDAMGDIVWSTAPQHDTLDDLVTRIKDITAASCTARGISYTISIDGAIPPVHLDDQSRKNLFLIFKESLNNVVKHAGASHVRLHVEYHDPGFHVVLADDGRGFTPTADAERGHGLTNMQTRAAEIGAQLSITSEHGKGTVVDLHYPLTKGT